MLKTKLFVHYILTHKAEEVIHNYIVSRKQLIQEIESSFKVNLNPAIAIICYYTDHEQYVKFLEDYKSACFLTRNPRLAMNKWEIYGYAIPKDTPLSSVIMDSLNSALEEPLTQDHVVFSQINETLYSFNVMDDDNETIRELHVATQSHEDIFLDTRILQDFEIKNSQILMKEEKDRKKQSFACWIKELRKKYLLDRESKSK